MSRVSKLARLHLAHLLYTIFGIFFMNFPLNIEEKRCFFIEKVSPFGSLLPSLCRSGAGVGVLNGLLYRYRCLQTWTKCFGQIMWFFYYENIFTQFHFLEFIWNAMLNNKFMKIILKRGRAWWSSSEEECGELQPRQ